MAFTATSSAVAAACVGLALAGAAQAGSLKQDRISQRIRAAVAETIAGINAHDPVRATAFEADDVIFMQPDQPNTHGRAADLAGFRQGFAADPGWHVSLVEDHVDVAASGDLAVYRSIYNEDGLRNGVPMTHKVNFVAEFERQTDGSWKMPWYVISPLEPSHKK